MAAGILLTLAILSEVVATVFLRFTDGFTNLAPSIVVVVGYGLSFWLLALILKDLEIGFVYAVWSGAGTALIAAVGMIAFGETATALKFLSIALIILGGDHGITLGELRSVAKHHGPVGLIDFDSHTDTWDSYWGERYTHGTWCKRAIEEGLIDTRRAVQLGIRGGLYGSEDRGGARALGLHLIPTEELMTRGVDDVLPEVLQRIGSGPVFLSFDIDSIDPGFAPGTGTPEVGGPSSRDALRLVRGLRGIDFVGFDLVEVLPQYDSGQVTSLLAGTLVHEFLALLALRRQERPG